MANRVSGCDWNVSVPPTNVAQGVELRPMAFCSSKDVAVAVSSREWKAPAPFSDADCAVALRHKAPALFKCAVCGLQV